MLMKVTSRRRPRRPWDAAVRALDHAVGTTLPGRHPRRGSGGSDGRLRVLIPRGLSRLARQSGIGAAMRHQEQVVRSLGHEVVTNPLRSFDVMHLNTPFPDTPLLARWARLWGRPVLMWAHSTEDDFRDSFPGSNALAPMFRRWIAHLYRRGDAVITPSSYSRSLVSAPKYGITAPIHVLSNGVDTDFFRPDPSARQRLRAQLGLAPDAPVVVSVGMQLVRKGILDWVEVARAMPEVTFVWYGRTDPAMLTGEVQRAIAGAPGNARFPGYVDSHQLREAYCGADAFCFLTKEETEGIVLLEALACGAPTLLRSIPIYRDALPDGQITHQVRDDVPDFPRAVTERLRALLGGELADLRRPGRAVAEATDLRAVAARLAEIYQLTGVLPHRRFRSRAIEGGGSGNDGVDALQVRGDAAGATARAPLPVGGGAAPPGAGR